MQLYQQHNLLLTVTLVVLLLISNKGDSSSNNTVAGVVDTGSAGSGSGHSHNMSATFSGDATSVIQPYLALIYIIKT
jgi:hypothetical protein